MGTGELSDDVSHCRPPDIWPLQPQGADQTAQTFSVIVPIPESRDAAAVLADQQQLGSVYAGLRRREDGSSRCAPDAVPGEAASATEGVAPSDPPFVDNTPAEGRKE